MATTTTGGKLTLAPPRTAPRGRLRAVARWSLVIVLAWSAGGKFFWPLRLQALLLATGLIPSELLTPLVYTLPALEFALGIALATRLLLTPALFITVFLSTAFAAVHVYLIASGTLVPCGCAGVALDFSGRWFQILILAVSLAMLCASLFLLFRSTTPPRPAAPRDPELNNTDPGAA